MPWPKSEHDSIKLRAHKIGDRVIGRRLPDRFPGILVDAYVTLNCRINGVTIYRNPAYVVLCDKDGKRRSFQSLRSY